jgi:hypothetical protein
MQTPNLLKACFHFHVVPPLDFLFLRANVYILYIYSNKKHGKNISDNVLFLKIVIMHRKLPLEEVRYY